MLFTVDSAKQFLLSKLVEQSQRDNVPLDEVERRMFLFSESTVPDFDAQEKFDKEYATDAYEKKVARLLRRSYARVKKEKDAANEWKEALNALRHEDFYGLVMVDQAKIPRVNAAMWAFLANMIPFALLELAVVALGWIVVFEPYRLRLHLPDWFRLLLLGGFFWLFWYVGQVFGRIKRLKATKSPEPGQS
jgi:hypothetical protein